MTIKEYNVCMISVNNALLKIRDIKKEVGDVYSLKSLEADLNDFREYLSKHTLNEPEN